MNFSLQRAVISLGGLLTVANLAFSQTWTQTSAPVQYWSSVASSADGTKLVAVAGENNSHTGPIYVSTNSGASWIATSAPTTYWVAVASSADGSKLVAVVYYPGKIYTSTNSGVDWIQASNAPSNIGWASIGSSADGTKLVSGARANYVYTSTNAGATWTKNDYMYGYWNAFASSADASLLVAAGDSVCTSTNSGVSWIVTSAPGGSPPYWSVACSADGSKLIGAKGGVTGNGTIYTSTNSGATWGSNATPKIQWAAVASSAEGTHLIAAAIGPGPLYTSTNSGVTWISNSIPTKVWTSVASSADGSKLVGTVKNGAIYTWQAIPTLSISAFNTSLVLAWPSNSASSGFVVQQNLDLATTNWTEVTTVLTVTNQHYQAVVSAPISSRFYRLISR